MASFTMKEREEKWSGFKDWGKAGENVQKRMTNNPKAGMSRTFFPTVVFALVTENRLFPDI